MRPVLARAAFCLTLCGWGLSAARAETCPEVPDDEVAVRRSMAKEWFARAEESEAAGDRQAAIRRYACSLNLAPHPSTAYNLGTVAEKSGDAMMALDGFRTYLKLSPQAADRPSIEARIAALEAKIADLPKLKTGAPKPGAPPAVAAAPPPAAPPVTTRTAATQDDGSHGRHVAGWITLAGGGVALGAGVGLNLMARSKMDECYRLYTSGAPNALKSCDAAKPRAYASYAALGVGAAAAVTGLMLLVWPAESSGSGGEGSGVAFVPLSGGGAFIARGSF